PAALHEIPLVRDQHVTNEARIVQQEDVLAGHAYVREVPVRPGEIREERQRIPKGTIGDRGPQRSRRPWRKASGRGPARGAHSGYAPSSGPTRTVHGRTRHSTTKP